MNFSVNWLAVIVAAIASMALGFAWYMALGKQWMAALGKSGQQMNSRDPTPFIWAFVVQLVMAYFLSALTPALYGAITIWGGILTGLQMWLGFVITSMILNHRYQGASWALTLIDGGYLLGVLIVQGLVIGLFG